MFVPVDIRQTLSPLGPQWSPLYSYPVAFTRTHFDAAMDNIIRNPDINSTVLMRADIYFQFVDGTIYGNNIASVKLDASWLTVDLEDIQPRLLEIPGYEVTSYIVRRNIPRNPHRDTIINQSCVTYTNLLSTDRLVVYIPHCKRTDMPFYLPEAAAVALLFSGPTNFNPQALCSIHYLLYSDEANSLLVRDGSDRLLRIGYHLLETCVKHARGIQMGYKKRVNHDQMVERKGLQSRYILLKQKYATELLDNWVEKTDPRKHVFEDLGIAAFLIELWKQMYKSPNDFEFLDLGCGNGLLVHILLNEGFKGRGIDIRARKSWATYSEATQRALSRRLIVPDVLRSEGTSLSNDEEIAWLGAEPAKGEPEIFYIGNHTDELTLWLPLLNHPFMVIPCCSYSLSGEKKRFTPQGSKQKSTYAALLDKVTKLAGAAGWKIEHEMLRIPSTRNAAIVGRKRLINKDIAEIVQSEGGASGWIENTRRLKFSESEH